MTIKEHKKIPSPSLPSSAAPAHLAKTPHAAASTQRAVKAKGLKVTKTVALPKTLAELRDNLTHHRKLSETQIRDLRSAISGVGKAAGLPLSQIPTDIVKLRTILQNAHAVQLGVSKKRFANMKAGLVRAMTVSGLLPPYGKSVHSPAWTAFLSLTPVRHQAWGLSRFATYCSHHDIDPMDVELTNLQDFQEWLDLTLVANDPATATRTAGMNYNAILRRAQCERPLLNLSRKDHYLARSLNSYPSSFRKDLEAYLNRLRNPDLFGDDGPERALKEISLRNIHAHVRQLADAAVTAGYPAQGFTRLEDLVQVPVLRSAVEAIRTRTGQEYSAGMHNIMTTALNIGRYYVKLPAKDLNVISKAKAKIADVADYNMPRLTEKNQARLAQFADGENFTRLILLPEALMADANKSKGSPLAALDAMFAVAIAILLNCPMRAKNLAHLDIKKHLIQHKDGKETLYGVHVPKVEVKNRQDIDSDFSVAVTGLIRDYLTHHHPVIAPSTTALFPRPDGRPRDPGKLAELVQERIRKWLGLKVHMHLFRHLAAMQYLEAYPGQYESVRRLLGHAKIDTTTSYYAPLSNKAIQRNYHEVVLQAKCLVNKSKGQK